METAAQLAQPKPYYYTARAYCERFGLGPEELERVRMSFAVTELRARMQPWMDQLVKLHPSMYSLDINAPLPQTYLDLQAQVEEMRRMEAEKLGISL